jgi:hydrogenase maturation protease
MPMPKPPPAPPAKRRALSTRVLCLGNDLLADDAFGPVVARTLKELYLPGVEVVESPASGLHLLEHVLDA